MSQISPPIRIVLAVAVVFMAAWFVLLRPGTEPVATTPAPAPGSGLSSAVESAKATAAQGGAPATASAPATEAGGASAPAPAAAKPATAKAAKSGLGLPAPVAKAVAKRKTLVMLFWNRKAYDDQAVRRELRGIDRRKGNVQVHVASIKDVARYAPITRGVNLEQSPTVLVIKGNTADALVGYVDRGTINQSVSDVIRSSRNDDAVGGPSDPYLAQVSARCEQAKRDGAALLQNRPTDKDSALKFLDGLIAMSAKADADLAAMKAPKKYRAFKRDFDRVNRTSTELARGFVGKLKAAESPAAVTGLVQQLLRDVDALTAQLKAKYSKLGVSTCFE